MRGKGPDMIDGLIMWFSVLKFVWTVRVKDDRTECAHRGDKRRIMSRWQMLEREKRNVEGAAAFRGQWTDQWFCMKASLSVISALFNKSIYLWFLLSLLLLVLCTHWSCRMNMRIYVLPVYLHHLCFIFHFGTTKWSIFFNYSLLGLTRGDIFYYGCKMNGVIHEINCWSCELIAYTQN